MCLQEEVPQFRTPATREMKPPTGHSVPYVVESSGQATPLLHTVSFYRKQQAQVEWNTILSCGGNLNLLGVHF